MLFSAVQKITTCFCNDRGDRKCGTGTGFWLATSQEHVHFVTNRHNIDPTMHRAELRAYRFCSASISLRAFSLKDSLPCRDVMTLELSADGIKIFYPKDGGDVVLLRGEKLWIPADPNQALVGIPGNSLSYHRSPEILDKLFFVGFPGKQRDAAAYDLPIIRSCVIASLPGIDYSEEERTIGSANTCLVEGLSFGGSSGSPVFKDFEGTLELFGIMSGHFKGEICPLCQYT